MIMTNNTKRILVLDDEPDVVTYLETLLRDNGYDTRTARNGREGMDLIRKEKPDLITLDISMPESSGTRFYKELKNDPQLSDIPVVVVTAVTGSGGDPYAFREIMTHRQQVPPPEGYIPKPIEIDDFLETIATILA